MSDWTGGYVADIAYTHGYYAELNPLRLRLAFLRAGLAFPEAGVACELGFGQGISTNVHGAASMTRWYGTDFNPAQAGYAQELAQASGASVHLFDEAFEQFCTRSDLPDFDFIGLHGIWSWVSDENRHLIADFLKRKLKVGGVVYISYNTQPGWAAMAPLRDLLAEHAEMMGTPAAGIVPRIDASIEFADKLLKSGALYGRVNPNVAPRLEAIKKMNRNYVAHEYFNRHWVPMSFAKIAPWMDEAKLTFACSAHYLDHVDGINLSAEQQALLNEVPDRMFRETVRDFVVNSQFRRDYWVRGMRPLTPIEKVEGMRRQRFVLAVPRDQVSMKVTGATGEGTMHEDVYGPILNFLSDHSIRTFREIEQVVEANKLNYHGLVEAMMVLVGKGSVHPVQDDAAISTAAPQAQRLNRKLCDQARFSDAVNVLASPVTGGGITVSRLDMLFMLARAQGKKDPQEWARFMVYTMNVQGRRVLKDGKIPETSEAEFEEASRIARDFQDQRLPMLDALRVEC